MRIIGEIAHAKYKITAMKNEGRLLLKIEDGLLEQTFKFRASEELSNISQIAQLVNGEFLQTVSVCFAQMQAAHQKTLTNYLQSLEQDSLNLPDII